MINKWILDNFKSIESREELEFRPLTIFTGANSSGKSTILQSILLVSQTLQSAMDSKSIVLNGGIKKFGSYSDVVNRRDFNKNMTVGFEIVDEMIAYKRFSTPWMDDIKQLNCEFVVGAKKDDDLQPYVKELHIKCNDSTKRSSSMDIVKNQGLQGKVKELVERKKLPKLAEMDYDASVNIEGGFSRIRFNGRGLDNNYIGASFTHFLPRYLLYYYNKFDRAAYWLFNRMMVDGGHIGYWELDPEETQALSEAIKPKSEEIADNLKTTVFDTLKNDRRKAQFMDLYNLYKTDFQIETLVELIYISGLRAEERESITDELEKTIKSLEPSYAVDRNFSHLLPGIEFIKEFFCNHIWYLGPLREEPKALYPLESDGSAKDVGYKGENTAAVYDNNRNEKISYLPPVCIENLEDIKIKAKKGTLKEAVKEWLVYLGVANEITTDDQGKIGHTMQISNDLKMNQDLTHVGVGVSQVLPILIMSLLAEKGDVIILEQPELHLHPKVQARLADFFVSMNVLGKQCILETHSEYLINRLRLLVAKSDDAKIAEETMIYFVEKDKEIGCSKYREVTINPYGVIADWPDGFFDEGEDLATQIAKAGMEKKRRELAKLKK